MKKIALATILLSAGLPVLAQEDDGMVHQNKALELMRNGNANEAIKEAHAALGDAKKLGKNVSSAQVTMINSYALLGKINLTQKNYAEAVNAWKQAIELARPIVDNKIKSDCMCGLAIAYTKMDSTDEAKQAADEAIEFITSAFGLDDQRIPLLQKISNGELCPNRSVADSVGATWMKNIDEGTKAMQAAEYSQAVVSFETAMDLIDKTQPDSREAAATLSTLASAYLKAGDMKKAEAAMRKALPLTKKYFADKPEMIEALENGLAAMKSKQFQQEQKPQQKTVPKTAQKAPQKAQPFGLQKLEPKMHPVAQPKPQPQPSSPSDSLW